MLCLKIKTCNKFYSFLFFTILFNFTGVCYAQPAGKSNSVDIVEGIKLVEEGIYVSPNHFNYYLLIVIVLVIVFIIVLLDDLFKRRNLNSQKRLLQVSESRLQIAVGSAGIHLREYDFLTGKDITPPEFAETLGVFSNIRLPKPNLDKIAQIYFHKDDTSDCKSQLDRIINGQEQKVFFEARVLKGGKYEWRALVCQRAGVGRGELYRERVILFSYDISVRKVLEVFEKEQEEKLIHADKMIALGTLVAGVAHEINNPNSSITFGVPIVKAMYSDMYRELEKYSSESGIIKIGSYTLKEAKEAGETMLGNIEQSAQRIKRIVTDLRNYARADQFGEIRDNVDINDVVKSSVRLLKSSLKGKCVLRMELAEALPLVQGNFQRLEQVIVNLVNNATESLPYPEGHVLICTDYNKNDDKVHIIVSDEGVGMKNEVLSQVLNPFFTTKRDQGGIGLGLSVSHSIAKEHRGSIRFNSKVGAGTVVTFTIPVSSLK